jgi:hypothetical protein
VEEDDVEETAEGVELVDGDEGSGVMQNLLSPYSANNGFSERSNRQEFILEEQRNSLRNISPAV